MSMNLARLATPCIETLEDVCCHSSGATHPPLQTRAMVYQPDADAEWATQQIQIMVKK